MKKLIKARLKINWLYIIVIVLTACFVTAGILIYQRWIPKEVENDRIVHDTCLADNEVVDYEIEKKGGTLGLVKVSIYDKESNTKSFNFVIDNIRKNYHPIEIHKCGIYVIRMFNYDYKKTKQDPGYKAELWKYTYDGNGESMFLLHEKTDENEYKSYFATDFRINLTETYLVLQRSYAGTSSYALIVKNLKTREDVFVFPIRNIEGNIGLREWTKDSRYFWADIFIGAYVLGFIRIDTINWDTEIFEVPEGILGGSALNIERGYITRHPGHVWLGIKQAVEQEKQEWQEQGKVSSLYIYNLFTKEETLIATTEEPLWFFKPKWISDTELEYELPSGEKKIYSIENK